MDVQRGRHEDRTRVVCNLPLNDLQQERAVKYIIEYLKGQQAEPIGVQGFTHSAFVPTAYYGYWWLAKESRWVRDHLVLLIVDYRIAPDDEASLSHHIARLQAEIRRSYRRYRRPQQKVWLVAQRIVRHE